MATITPVVGSIGQKTDRNSLLTYALTGTMSTITEKVNGVVVGTKTATSGQSLTVALTQAQWDAIAFGKYRNYRNLVPEYTNANYNSLVGSSSAKDNAWVNEKLEIYNGSFNVFGKGIVLNLIPNKPYTLSFDSSNATDGVYAKVATGYSADGFDLSDTALSGFSFTPTQNKVYFRFLRHGNTALADPVKIWNIQVTEGNTVQPFKNPSEIGNTLTVTMGSEEFTYTFDKRLATDTDLLSAVKAAKDTNEVYLPTLKNKLVSKVGGNVTDNFETIIDGFVLGKKFIEINATSNASGRVIATGLTFRPKVIIAYNTVARTYALFETYSSELNYLYSVSATVNNISTPFAKTDAIITDTSFDVFVNVTGAAFKCYVFG